MKTVLAGISVLSMIILLINPAFAEVTSVNLQKSFYTDDEGFIFEGNESIGSQSVFVIIRSSSGGYVTMVSDPSSGSDKKFETIPRTVESIFNREGEYTATAFTDEQKEESGVTLRLLYDDNKLSIFEAFTLSLRPITDKSVEIEKTITFTATVTDSSIKDLVFSLNNEPSGASIDSKTGKFSWTPQKSHGNIQDVHYSFDVIVTNGIQEDKERVTITVKQAFEDPKPEPTKQEPKEDKEPEPLAIPAPFVDESKDPQSYVDRYNNEASYKKWFDDNYPEYDSIEHAVGLVDDTSDEEPKEDEQVVDEEVFGECGKGTSLVDGVCKPDQSNTNNGGGCLIATAAYGSEMAPQVQLLREIRDNQLMNTSSGISFMSGFNQVYYSFSPAIADAQRENPLFKEAVKVAITPMLSSLSIMGAAESETEVLGYGIGVILMNLGLYVGIPAVVIYKLAGMRKVRF